MNIDLDILFEARLSINEKIKHYFDETGGYYPGDKGYQDLLQRLDEINEEIEELTNNEK